MTNSLKIVIAFAVTGAVAGLLAFFGLTPFGKTIVHQMVAGASPAGTTFNSAKIAAVSMVPLSAGATSTSILNNDANIRWMAGFGMAACTGVGTSNTFPSTGTGLAAWSVQAATTSVPNNGLQGNTNYAMNLTIPTSTPVENISTSTPSAQWGLWAPGTYMTFTTNATNTAACVFEMDYVSS